MSIKLVKALKVAEEEHAYAFERFANAFLVDDYPELKALGGKKDKGMDAYIYADETGKVVLVARSCVSPASRAHTKCARHDHEAEGQQAPATLLHLLYVGQRRPSEAGVRAIVSTAVC